MRPRPTNDSNQQKPSKAAHFDLLGSTAIIETKNLKDKGKSLAELILKNNKNIKTVLAKAGPVTGQYRTRKYRYVAGKRRYTVEYRESGCTFSFDPRRTFFSPRLSYERSRINGLVNGGENVMVLFAGAGPFVVVIAKSHKDVHVVGIEKNPYAYRMMKKNIANNKVLNAIADKGDVKKRAHFYSGFADRVVMPLPWSSIDFLDDAIRIAKHEAIIHIYVFGETKSVLKESLKLIKLHAKKNHYSVKRLFSRTVRPYSAKESEIVIDFKILKSKRSNVKQHKQKK